jgi:hypothetical protein
MAECIKELTVTPAVLLGCRSFSIEASMTAQIRAPGGLQKDLRTPPHPPCPPTPLVSQCCYNAVLTMKPCILFSPRPSVATKNHIKQQTTFRNSMSQRSLKSFIKCINLQFHLQESSGIQCQEFCQVHKFLISSSGLSRDSIS